VQRALEAVTAEWHAATTPSAGRSGPEPDKRRPDRLRTIEEPGYTTWIAVGHPMPAVAAADESAVAVMTEILNIRLNIAIREIRSLANAAQVHVTANVRHSGLLHVRSGARPESIAPIIHFSLQELDRIRESSGAPGGDEIEQVKGGLVLGKWQASLDGAREASATYASEAARFGSLDHLIDWPRAVRVVAAAAVVSAAQTYIHPELMGIVVVGQIEDVRAARHPPWPFALDDLMASTRR